MRERVLARFAAAGARGHDLDLLDLCLTAALRAREAELPEAHPLLLHPARSVLILIDDADVSDVSTLAAAALLDSEQPRWRGSALLGHPTSGSGTGRAAALCDAVPTPDRVPTERLLEELIVAAPDVRLIGCAERLDLARHVHLVDPNAVARWVSQVRTLYAPVAARTEPRLARRFLRWAGAHERRIKGE